MGLKIGTVRLEKHNSVWKIEFEREKEKLREIFNDYAISIEHVGSTSVPKISAKPIIDIAVGVNNLKNVSVIKEMFSNHSDYSLKENSEDGEILVVKRLREDYTTHLIHIMELNSDRYKDTILFRDYLINFSKERNEYEKLKTELASKYSDDRKSYTRSKNKFISEVLNKARKKTNK